jgi:hypothetical protein
MNYPSLRVHILELFAEAQHAIESRYRWDERAGMTVIRSRPGEGKRGAERERVANDWKGNAPVPPPLPFACSCGARFGTQPALTTHRRVVHGLRPVPGPRAPLAAPLVRKAQAPRLKLTPGQARLLARAQAKGEPLELEWDEIVSASALARRGLGTLVGRTFRLA